MTDRYRPDDLARTPAYPEITRAQWAVLSAWTDQRCENMMEAADFVADLSPEAKAFFKSADKQKIERLNANIDFYASSRAIWKFFWIGGTMLIGGIQIWKAFGDYISVKFK